MTALLRRVGPALALLLIAPFVAEFLLGDFSIRQIGYLAVFLPQYGGGALLVREITRRTGRGWPTMLTLALVYGLVEEGVTTQSLFNPNYADQRLLDYGFISSLGISANWTLFVLTLHVVWSLGASIALAEALAGVRWREPWLKTPGLVLTTILFLAGCALTMFGTAYIYPYVSSPLQFVGVGVTTAIVALAAFLLFRRSATRSGSSAPSPWLVGAVSLVLCSAFQLINRFGPVVGLAAPVTMVLMLAVVSLGIVVLAMWSKASDWGPLEALAAATGAVLTYGWLSLWRLIFAGRTAMGAVASPIDIAGQAGFVAVMLGVVWLGAHRLGRASPGGPGVG